MTKSMATLRRALRTATSRIPSPSTEQELLRQFAEREDQDAFESLVRRHTGLVLGVCRRTLSNALDAEDACQATFLILARKARSGRWRPSIANWLFATARRVAKDLRRSAERRTKREGAAAISVSVDAVDRMTGRELLGIFDEELDRLPSIYRELLLLFYQEELGRIEIAKRLGIPAGTVKIRMERGRKKLTVALTRRGIAKGAGLLTLMASSPAGASSPQTFAAIRAALAGDVSSSVAALARGIAMNGVIKKSLFSLVAVSAIAIVGIGSGQPTVMTAGQTIEKETPAKETEKPKPTAAKDEAAATRTITGQVVDPDGKPAPNAEMIHFPIEGKPTVEGKTDTAKRLEVKPAETLDAGTITLKLPNDE